MRRPRKAIRGNCYVTSEALYHLLGGKAKGWMAMRMRWEGDAHYYLVNLYTGQKVDATARQFKTPPTVHDYTKARATGFLTKQPSKKARAMMKNMLWQYPI